MGRNGSSEKKEIEEEEKGCKLYTTPAWRWSPDARNKWSPDARIRWSPDARTEWSPDARTEWSPDARNGSSEKKEIEEEEKGCKLYTTPAWRWSPDARNRWS